MAMDILAYRDHSRLELEEKLSKKLARQLEAGELTPADIAGLLDSLVAEGLLVEHRYAESFINSRMRKGQGPVRIRRDLGQKGLARSILEQAFDASQIDWLAEARSVRQKKFGDGPPADYKERARQARF
jgi:regulatory protein